MTDYNASTDPPHTTPPPGPNPTDTTPKPQSLIDQAKNAVTKAFDAISGRKR